MLMMRINDLYGAPQSVIRQKYEYRYISPKFSVERVLNALDEK